MQGQTGVGACFLVAGAADVAVVDAVVAVGGAAAADVVVVAQAGVGVVVLHWSCTAPSMYHKV